MKSNEAPSLETPFLPLVDIEEGWKLLERFSELVRESGTPDEEAAAQYISERLEAMGIPHHVHRPELLVSLPRGAEIELTSSQGAFRPRAKTSSFSLSTDGRAVSGQAVHLPAERCKAVTDLFDPHFASSDVEVEGKIVVTEGYAMPATVEMLENRGAAAQIYINPGQNIHEGICTTIWGTPLPADLERKPSTPVACINRPDGDRLVGLLQAGEVRASLRTRLKESFAACPLPEVRIKGAEDPDHFLLVHGHYDSWHEGIGDNATGNALLLELARIFHKRRGDLKRGLRIAWWPAHSTGRYAGSTWYADEFAMDLRKHCVGQVNIDSPGCRHATAFEEVMWMMECEHLCAQAIRDRTGQRSNRLRPIRAGDYSFNQIGLSSFFMLLSSRPREERERAGFYPVGGCGGDIAWHTEDDTLDVASPEIMRQDLGVYVTALARVLNSSVLPYDFRLVTEELLAALAQAQEAAGDSFSLAPADQECTALAEEVTDFHGFSESPLAEGKEDRINHVLLQLARFLVPLNYAKGERFDHDPAKSLGVIPKLEGLSALSRLERGSDQWRFERARLTRQRNKVANRFYETALYLRCQRQLLGY